MFITNIDIFIKVTKENLHQSYGLRRLHGFQNLCLELMNSHYFSNNDMIVENCGVFVVVIYI